MRALLVPPLLLYAMVIAAWHWLLTTGSWRGVGSQRLWQVRGWVLVSGGDC